MDLDSKPSSTDPLFSRIENKIFEHWLVTPIMLVFIIPLSIFMQWVNGFNLEGNLAVIGIIGLMSSLEYIMSKMDSDKGFFGKHSCHTLGSICMRFGKWQDDLGNYHCDAHADEERSIKEMVRKCAEGKISNDQFWAWRKMTR